MSVSTTAENAAQLRTDLRQLAKQQAPNSSAVTQNHTAPLPMVENMYDEASDRNVPAPSHQ